MNIKRNIIYSSFLVAGNYIFPLITFPYISRVLGVENIGNINFVDSVVNYYIMFSMLGLNLLGIREIAKNKINREECSFVFSTLLTMNFIISILLILIYLITLIAIPQFSENRQLFYLGTIKLFFNIFLLEWLYKGLEDFKYITICNTLLRSCYVLCVLLFVRDTDDSRMYYMITVLLIVFSAIVNSTHSRKYVRYRFIYWADIKKYINPYFKLGIYLILTSTYTTFNVIYLGLVSSSKEVGFYVTALKIYTIILGLFTAFTNVMMPSMSVLLAKNDMQSFRNLIIKSFSIFLSIGFLLVSLLVTLGPEIINIVAGSGYEGSIIPMRIIAPLILVVGCAQIIAIQVLIPLGKDNVVLRNSVIGAIVGLFLNVLLVPYYGAVGTSITLFCSEISVTIMLLSYIVKTRIFAIPWREIFKQYVWALPYCAICLLIRNVLFVDYNVIYIISLSCFFCLIYFAIIQCVVLKNSTFINLFCKCREYFNYRKL